MTSTFVTTDRLPFQSLLEQRRTVRALTDGPIQPELLSDLARAVALTPAAYNRPPWRVVIIHEQRVPFWAAVEDAFRANLDGERLARYLHRLDQFRSGLGAILIFEDRSIASQLLTGHGTPHETASAYIQQAIGMVQLSLWLALIDHGLGTSLQHWDWLIEDALPPITGLPVDRFALAAVMPFGYPADTGLGSERRDAPTSLIAIDSPFAGDDW